MQNGFFDDLLTEMKNEKEVQEDSETGEIIESPTTDISNINFGDVVQEETKEVEGVKKVEEVKVEEKAVEKPKKEAQNKRTKTPQNSVETPKVDNLPSNEEKVEKKAEKQPQTSMVAKPKDITALLIESTLDKINDIVAYSNETFSTRAKECASDIIVSLSHTLNERGYNWKQIDTKGSGMIMQIKRWSKLGIDVTNDKLYADIRNNSKTGLFDIRIKAQYQTVEKLIIKYCSKKIFRFKTEVICVGDDLQTEFDYLLGEERVTKFVPDNKVNRNMLDNIIGAFKIAYYSENGQVKQIVTRIDKDRIMRAYESATTKNVWNRDTQKMVKKTVTWEMFNGEDIRPFMEYPEDIIQDLSVVNEGEDIDFNKEHKYSNVVDAQENIESTIGNGESVEI